MKSRNIIPVILTGGPESRLWPVSRDGLPHEFARIFGGPTLFQQAVLRTADTHHFDAPVVVTEKRHLALVRSQLAEIACEAANILCVPSCRGSAPAVALAATLQLGRPDSALLIMPASQAVADGFAFSRVLQVGLRLARRNACIVTYGVRPTSVETGRGFIRAGDPIFGEGGMLLDAFIERPSQAQIAELVRQPGIYWNAGIYLSDRSVLAGEFREHAPLLMAGVDASVDRGVWDGDCFHPEPDEYEGLEAAGFDAVILERTERAALVPAELGLSDFASWKSVWEQSERDRNDNATSGPVWFANSRNSLAVSDGPVVGVAGLDDVVVVANRDAVLVASRHGAADIDSLVAAMRNDGATGLLDRSGETAAWGKCEVLDKGGDHQVRRLTIHSGGRFDLHYHHHRAEHWVVVSGLATVTIDDRVLTLGPCQQAFVPQGAVHRLENLTSDPLVVIEVQYGAYLGDDDAIPVEDLYERERAGGRRYGKAA